MTKLKPYGKALLLVILCLAFLLPILWVILSSFKNNTELYQFPPVIFPKNPTLDSYVTALSKGDFATAFYNTTLVTIAATILTVLFNASAGYALAKYHFRMREFILLVFISTLVVPIEVIMVPIFTVIKDVGFFNSLLGLIIPPAASPFGLFLVRQYLLSVPDDLIEAARIDGGSEWYIFRSIILPICRPILAVLAVFSFLWRWNDYIWPLIVLYDPKKYTIQMLISKFIGEYNVDWNSLLAMSIISMIPVLLVFILFQKQFISGMVSSGIKE